MKRTQAWIILTAAVALAGCGSKVSPTQACIDARTTLLQAADDPDPQIQTKALEALAATEGAAAGPVMTQRLRNGSAPVQFAAAMAIGDCRYEPAQPLLLELVKAPDCPPKLMVALAYALHQTGDDSYTREIGRLLYHLDKWVRASAAMVMGRMGDPSAAGPLRTVQSNDHDPVVQLQIVEAMARLGNERAMVLLEAFTKSQFLEDRIIAAQGLGYLNNDRAVYVLRQLVNDSKQDPAVRVVAAGSLARLKRPEGFTLVRMAVANPSRVMWWSRGGKVKVGQQELDNLQTVAILALAVLGDPGDVQRLHPLLKSPVGAVRVAAAQAILRLLPNYRSPAAMARPRLAPVGEAVSEPASRPASSPTLRSAGAKEAK